MALNRNVFARLFPAAFGPEDIDENDGTVSDPDRPAPEGPQSRSGGFVMPHGVYTRATPMDQPTSQPSPTVPKSNVLPFDRLRDKFSFDPSLPLGAQTPPTPEPAIEQQTGSAANYYNPMAIAGDMGPAPQLSARDKAKMKLDAVINRKIEDNDQGFKNRFGEVLQNVFAGMDIAYRANPNGHWAGILAGGAAGGVGGAVDKTWDERRRHEQDLAEANRNYEVANKAEEESSKLKDASTKRAVDEYKAMTEREKAIADSLTDRQRAFITRLNDIDEIDPADPDPLVQQVIAEGKAAGVTVLKKTKGSKFNFNITPDGQLIVGDTTTGAYKKGEGNYAKPPTIDDKDLPDSLFGLKDDTTIDTEAKASVAKGPRQRRRRPEMEAALKGQKDENGNPVYVGADGNLDESKLTPDELDKLYEQLPDNSEQSIAAYKRDALKAQEWKAREVAKFRSAIKNAPAGNTPVPLQQIVESFNAVLAIKDPKKRAAALKRYYSEVLPNIRAK